MSTNKTEHYALHAWEPGDSFLRTEINENFAALDAAAGVLREVMGTYAGDGQSDGQDVELGFRPSAVLVLGNALQITGDGIDPVILAFDGSGNRYLEVTDSGFHVQASLNNTEISASNPVNPYRYIAWR